jgi:glycosyltransferase involved in cell wall biosynthesis
MVHPGPDFSVADVFNGWKRAFEKQGHEVAVFNTNDRLNFYSQVSFPDYNTEVGPCKECGFMPYRAAMDKEDAVRAAMQGLTHELYSVWPHMVFFVSAFFTPAWVLDLIRARRHKLVLAHTESPYQDDEQLMRAQYATLNLLNDPANIEEYAQLAPAMYMPHAYDPDIHYPGRGKKNIDFTFIGTMFESRREFFEELFSNIDTEKYKIALGGAAWDCDHMEGSPLLKYVGHALNECVDNDEVAKIYRRSKVGINFYRRESEDDHKGEGWAIGPREIETAACGIPWIRDARGESDELFPFLPTYKTAREAADLLTWYLEDEELRKKLGRKARNAIKDRTFDNHAALLMKEMAKFGLL